jgi:hypothetical protein
MPATKKTKKAQYRPMAGLVSCSPATTVTSETKLTNNSKKPIAVLWAYTKSIIIFLFQIRAVFEVKSQSRLATKSVIGTP